MRRCIVTRAQGERARLIRFVVGPDGAIVPDLAARLPGRGLWLSARRDVLQTACAKGAFARAARRPVMVAADIAERIETGLATRIGECLGLARRAGQAVAGFAKAREWLRGGRAGLIIQANDGSSAECQRLLSGSDDDLLVIRPMTSVRLGAVFGRDHVVHVAVARGRLADTLAIEAERLAGMLGVGYSAAGTSAQPAQEAAARRP